MERPQPVIDLFDYLNQHGAMPELSAKKIFRQVRIQDWIISMQSLGQIDRIKAFILPLPNTLSSDRVKLQ